MSQGAEEIKKERKDLAGGENDRVRFLLKKQEIEGLSDDEKFELIELIKTISASIPKEQEGIMRVASARGDREYLISVLSRYYTPRDLYYKNIKELNQMLQMHLTESGGLI